MPERRELHYKDFAELRADVTRLRGGYERAGNWSLAQACYHLDHTLIGAMKPMPYAPNTPEQDGRRAIFDGIMRTGQIPSGLTAGADTAPPADVPESAIESLFETIDRFERFPGPFSPHRLFGNLPPDVRRKHQLIHAAHHLSYLIPATEGPGARGQGPEKK